MAVEGVGAVFNDGSGNISEIVSISVPGNEVKEYEVTTLADTREQFKKSAMYVAQECELTLRYNPEVPPLSTGSDLSSAVITMAKQTSGSTSGATYTFDSFVKSTSPIVADVASSEGIIETVVLRITSAVVFAAEA